MRILHLYRPRLPSERAQSVQVLRTCHALALAGHQVTLLADRGDDSDGMWSRMGLTPTPGLSVQIAPVQHPGLAGLWFRRSLSRWWNGAPGIILARDKQRLIEAIAKHGKGQHRILLETHELDSIQPDGSLDSKRHALESECLAVSDGLVANCGGTLAAWQDHHALSIPTWVCHNATHVLSTDMKHSTDCVLVLGSMRSNKGVTTVLEAVQNISTPFRWVGGTGEERERYGPDPALEPPVPHSTIEHTLSQASVLLLPLGDNRFSHRFTSPLKLWDYLATDRPIVAAKTKAVDEICRKASTEVFLYEPDNPASIQQAIADALRAPPREPYRRPWAMRANELTQIMQEIA